MKKETFSSILLILMFMLVANNTLAGNPQNLRIGSGGSKGNYFSMANDIKSYCAEPLAKTANLEVLESNASVANIEGMTKKTYTAGIVQEDVLQYYGKHYEAKVNRNTIKVIAGLHMEVVYVLIPKNFQPKTKEKSLWSKATSIFSGGDESPGPINLNILEGQNVAASGGSVISAKALKFFAKVNFNVVDVTDSKDYGDMPIIMVGGQPYGPVEEKLSSGKYILISLDADSITTQAPFYFKVAASYNVGGKSYTANTVGIRALLVGKSFRKDSRNENMTRLASCIDKRLVDMADDPETNPNWQSVYDLNEDANQTNWAYFPLK